MPDDSSRVGVEALPLFDATITTRDEVVPNRPRDAWRGAELRDAALAQSRKGREAQIQAVRDWLLQRKVADQLLTGDDVMEAITALGLDHGDHRWSGHCLKGWPLVSPTIHFQPSRRKDRHAAPLRCWRWV